jgi:hypothetical protein
MEKRTKAEVLKAIEKIKTEYDNNTHTLGMTKCALCKLYGFKFTYPRNSEDGCNICLMRVFKGKDCYSCMNRKCTPIDCEEQYYKNSRELISVRKFYAVLLEKVQAMTEEEVLEDNWKFLLALDKDIAEEIKSLYV